MKRVFALILAFCLLMCAGCNRDVTGDTTQFVGEETGNTTETTEDTVETTEELPEETSSERETEETTGCSHDYRQTDLKEATCADAGSQQLTCTKCGEVTNERLSPKGHSYKDATCLDPKTCTDCNQTEGEALGHSYGADHMCIRCGMQNPVTLPVDILATVRSDEGTPLSGVTVTVYTEDNDSVSAGSGVTDEKGTATIAIPVGSSKYTIVLSNVPEGYQAKPSYTFSGARITVNLKTLPVRSDPTDHSRARYEVGDTMMDFTVTDIDGRTYQLSQLLRENKLVILDFWYVSCNPCKQEFPYFEAALEAYGEDMVILAVDPFYSAEEIRNLRDELEISFPLFRDPLGLCGGFRVESYPTTVFIDSTGTIRKIHRKAFTDEAAFLRAIAAYM